MNGCRRTRGLVDRVVDGRVTEADREHAAACASCGPVLARAARFDDELRRTTRRLVTEELPRGILDEPVVGVTGGGAIGRRSAPGLAAIVVSVAILLTGTVIALAPGTGPRATPSPSAAPSQSPTPASTRTKPPFIERFKTTDVIRGQLAKLGYRCNDGFPLASVGPEPDALTKEAAACEAPESIGPFMFAVIVGEASNGKVVELHVKAGILGPDSPDSRAAVADEMARVFALSLLDEGAGQSGGGWAKVHVVELEPDTNADVILRQVDFNATRAANGSYFVVVRGVSST